MLLAVCWEACCVAAHTMRGSLKYVVMGQEIRLLQCMPLLACFLAARFTSLLPQTWLTGCGSVACAQCWCAGWRPIFACG